MDHNLSLLLKAARLHMSIEDAKAFETAVVDGVGYALARVAVVGSAIEFHQSGLFDDPSLPVLENLVCRCDSEQGAINVVAKLKQYWVTIQRSTPVLFPDDE